MGWKKWNYETVGMGIGVLIGVLSFVRTLMQLGIYGETIFFGLITIGWYAIAGFILGYLVGKIIKKIK